MTAGGKARRHRVVSITAIVVLACVAAVLVYFALRPAPVPDAGETPPGEPVPSVTSGALPIATAPSEPAPSAGAQTASGLFLDAVDGQVAARASAGSCTGSAPSVETTGDGGETWTARPLQTSDDVRQILSLEMVDADQIDLVVLVGPDCSPNLLSTFTGGQFWQLYPDRLSAQSYLVPGDSAQIVIAGASVANPCAAPLELAVSDGSAAVHCADITAIATTSPAGWLPVTASGLYAAAWSSSQSASTLLGGVLNPAACDGLQITSFASDGSDFAGTALGCAPSGSDPAATALGTGGGAIWLWSDVGVAVSTDGGLTWPVS